MMLAEHIGGRIEFREVRQEDKLLLAHAFDHFAHKITQRFGGSWMHDEVRDMTYLELDDGRMLTLEMHFELDIRASVVGLRRPTQAELVGDFGGTWAAEQKRKEITELRKEIEP